MSNKKSKLTKLAIAATMVSHIGTSYSSCPCCRLKKNVNTSGFIKENKKEEDDNKEEKRKESNS